MNHDDQTDALDALTATTELPKALPDSSPTYQKPELTCLGVLAFVGSP